MAEVTINYKDAVIATMDASGTKTLQTQGKYCEDDIEVVYARPSAPSGTKQISITQNGTTVEDVAAYANAEISVNVQGGGDTLGEWAADTLINYENAALTSIRSYAFAESGSQIQTISLPNVTTIGANAFRGCKARHINTPSAQSGNGTCWYGCPNIETIVLPSWVGGWIVDQMWSNCAKLEAIDFGSNTTELGRNALFTTDPVLTVVIIRANSVVQLRNTASFNNTPFASGGSGGTLYVPQDLIASYQAAANWSTILGYANNQILPIEGSIYENVYADGTPIT